MAKDKININKKMIPYSFDIVLGGQLFTVGVKYNEFADIFTVSLEKQGEIICYGEPIIYGKALFESLGGSNKYPALRIVPFDESNINTDVTWYNFGESVFLVIDNGGEAIE